MTDICIPYMRSPQCDFTFAVKNNNWRHRNKYHIMYNDSKSDAKLLSLWYHMRDCGCNLFFCFFPSLFVFCFSLKRIYGIEIIQFKTKKAMYWFFHDKVCVQRRIFCGSLWLNKQLKNKQTNQKQVQRVFTVFFFVCVCVCVNKGERWWAFCNLTYSHVWFSWMFLAYLNKLNLVISFLQIEFLRGFKWANYEWCHGRGCSNYQQCGEKWVWKQTRGTRGFEDVGRLMHFHRQFIKSLFFLPPLHVSRPLISPSHWLKQPVWWSLPLRSLY